MCDEIITLTGSLWGFGIAVVTYTNVRNSVGHSLIKARGRVYASVCFMIGPYTKNQFSHLTEFA